MIQINRLHQFIDDHRESAFSKIFLYAKSINGKFLTLNQRSAKMAGAEIKEIIGKSDTDLCWSQYADEYRRNDLDCIQSQKTILCQEKLLTWDNKNFFEISLKTPLVNKNNHIVGIAGMSFISK
ncbi:MAG: PAS domain-containing protein [Legionella longbeachae]|nr:PAS domain-containing protein [Legionella longbeachae]